MKVAFVSQLFDSVLPPKQSSIGIWTYEVARRLSDADRVAVIARRPLGEAARHEVGDIDVELVRSAPPRAWMRASSAWRRLRPGADPLFASPLYARDYLAQVVRRLRALDPDVIHVQNFFNHVPALRRALPDAAIIVHMHCDWLVQIDRALVARCLRDADLVVGCSEHVIGAARRRFPELPVDFAVLPNAANLAGVEELSVPRSPDTVLFVGRVSPEKGVHVLLEAWRRVRAARPSARLELLGPVGGIPRDLLVDLGDDPDVRDLARFYTPDLERRGGYRAALDDLIAPEDAGSVDFLGFEPHERVLARAAAATVLVNPSLSESFGMSLVEALAVGTPVIASRVGGMPEIVEATRGGVLVAKNDPATLANAILELLGNPAARAVMGACGRMAVIERFSWAGVARQTRRLHRQAFDASRRRLRIGVPAVA